MQAFTQIAALLVVATPIQAYSAAKSHTEHPHNFDLTSIEIGSNGLSDSKPIATENLIRRAKPRVQLQLKPDSAKDSEKMASTYQAGSTQTRIALRRALLWEDSLRDNVKLLIALLKDASVTPQGTLATAEVPDMWGEPARVYIAIRHLLSANPDLRNSYPEVSDAFLMTEGFAMTEGLLQQTITALSEVGQEDASNKVAAAIGPSGNTDEETKEGVAVEDLEKIPVQETKEGIAVEDQEKIPSRPILSGIAEAASIIGVSDMPGINADGSATHSPLGNILAQFNSMQGVATVATLIPTSPASAVAHVLARLPALSRPSPTQESDSDETSGKISRTNTTKDTPQKGSSDDSKSTATIIIEVVSNVISILILILFGTLYKSKVVDGISKLQPKEAGSRGKDFASPLFACFNNMHLCMYLCCCQGFRAAHNWTVAGVMEYWPAVILQAICAPCLPCIGGIWLRPKVRATLGLEEDCCMDFLKWTFCSPCAVGQEAMEIDEESGATVTCCMNLQLRGGETTNLVQQEEAEVKM